MRRAAWRWLIAACLAALPAGAAWAQGASPEWDRTVAAAEKEGSVTVNIPSGNTLRDFFVTEWPKAFPKITLTLSSIDEGTWIARVRIERSAGKYLWDASMSGSVTAFTMKNDGVTVPIVPELILPDVKDPATWGGWDHVFFDNEHQSVMATQSFLKMPYYNTKMLPPEKVKAGEGSHRSFSIRRSRKRSSGTTR